MRKIRRILGLSVIGVILIGGGRTVYSFIRYSKVENGISAIKQGQPRAFVISKIGMPNYHAGVCGEIEPALQTCALEYVYSHTFAPFVPEYHVVTFSAEDRVIDSEEYDSP